MQPIFIVLFATVMGLSCAPFYSLLPTVGWWLVIICILLFLVLHRRYHGISLVLLFLSILIFSNLRYPLAFPVRQDVVQIDKLARKVSLVGQVVDVRQLTSERTWLLVSVDTVASKQVENYLKKPLRVRLYLGEGTDKLLPGDHINCKVRLRQPRQFGVPGEFNWVRYLTSQHTDMTGWIKNVEKITVTQSKSKFPDRQVVQWRTGIATTIDSLMPTDRAYLVRALVLGEGRVIPDKIRKHLSKSGISHLFAISGLHLGMIALLGYRLLLCCYRRYPQLLNWQPPQRILPLVLLPLLFGYLLLTGDAVSTRRAFALALLGAVFLYWRYCINPLLLLASLAFISLQINPLLLWQAGWHLSFVGAAGIILWRPLWQHAGNELPIYIRYPLQLFIVTFAAMLATLPFVLSDFHLLAPAGIFANLLCVPVVTLLALPIGFAGLLLFPLVPQLSILLFQLCGLLLDFVLNVAGWFMAIPGLAGTYLFLSQWQYLAIVLAVLPLLLVVYLTRQVLFRFSLVVLIFILILWQFPRQQTQPITLTMFSVGQGESMLLRNNQNQTILIDGGGFYSNRFDVGERLLAPAFGELGVSKLDVVVLTHDDLDHRKGLIFILQNYRVGEFLIGNQFSELHHSLQRVLIAQKIPVKTIPAGWSDAPFWSVGEVRFFNGKSAECSKNDASLVTYLKVGDESLLLTGDLEATGVEKLLSIGLPYPISLLKIPHHGSRFSATDKLVDQIHPTYCLVSSGYQNRHHHPDSQVTKYLHHHNIPLYRTDLDGTLQAQLMADGWQVKCWLRGNFR